MDEVDPEAMAQPPHWDMRFIRNFMLVLGPVSSLFDFLTFGLLLLVFGAGEALFQTGWFIESLATQVLVIFVIRTRRNPLRSRPSPYLVMAALGVVALAVLLPFTALGRWFGFVAAAAFPARRTGGDARLLSGLGGSGEALVLPPPAAPGQLAGGGPAPEHSLRAAAELSAAVRIGQGTSRPDFAVCNRPPSEPYLRDSDIDQRKGGDHGRRPARTHGP